MHTTRGPPLSYNDVRIEKVDVIEMLPTVKATLVEEDMMILMILLQELRRLLRRSLAQSSNRVFARQGRGQNNLGGSRHVGYGGEGTRVCSKGTMQEDRRDLIDSTRTFLSQWTR